jgi:hypothetical protein
MWQPPILCDNPVTLLCLREISMRKKSSRQRERLFFEAWMIRITAAEDIGEQVEDLVFVEHG